MAKHKKLEDYTSPTNDVTATFKIGNTSKSCTSSKFKETALDVISDGFSQNAVDSYNKMIAERQKDAGSCSFPYSSVAKKGYIYSGNSSISEMNPISHCSSAYMDIAIASSLAQKGHNEESTAPSTNVKCQGIARNGRELGAAYGSKTGSRREVPAENTIEYYDKLYKENGLGDVRVNISDKKGLANHLTSEGIKPGARVVCETEEAKQVSAEVIAVKNGKNTDFYRINNVGLVRLNPDFPAHKALLEKAEQAVKDNKLMVWPHGVPEKEQYSAQRNFCAGANKLNIDYSYVKKETKEYMYTGINNKGEPTFSRLTQDGGEIDVPLSQLPITKTKAIVDHTQLCVAKAQKELHDSDYNNVDIVKKYVPNLEVSYKLKKELADGLENPEVKALQRFNNTYNPDNPYIKELMAQNENSSNTAEVMAGDKEKADMLGQQRAEAVKKSNTAPSFSHEAEAPTKAAGDKVLNTALRRQQDGRG